MHPSLVTLALALAAGPATAQELEPIGLYEWETDLVVGISGIEVSADGQRFTAISDRGYWLRGDFTREGEVITGLTLETIDALKGQNGFPVSARRVGDWSDAEGLAEAPDGTFWISFERWAHVWRYDGGINSVPQWIEDHPTFLDHAENWQLEAIALSPEGEVFTFSEKPLPEGFPIYRLDDADGWTIDGYLPEQDLFAIVGADFDENGDLYLLERKLVVGLWWQNRIRRVRLDGSEDIVLWTGERGEYLNLEGLSVWRDDTGVRLTLVSDDNGSKSDPTQFVEFRLTE